MGGTADASDHRQFLDQCRATLGAEAVRRPTPADVAHTGAHDRTVAAVVLPSDLDGVRAVVAAAREGRVPLYPLSQGRNWGLGSRLPVRSGAVLLDLSRMKRIRALDLTFGYAVVEPGVTQEDLARELRRRNARFFLDVTGAGASTSLIGNTLERGIAYNTQRTRNTRAFEVVLGDGSVVRTGFQDPRADGLNHVYDHGIGPDVRGLFQQSAFGVVTAMTIDLQPIPEAQASVNLNLDAARLPALMGSLRDLLLEGIVQPIPHIANRERTRSTLVPMLRGMNGSGFSVAEAERLLGGLLPREWSTLISVAGPRRLQRAKIALLRRRLRGLGDLRVVTPARARWGLRLSRLFSSRLHAFLESAVRLNSLAFGVPTDDPQRFLDYEAAGRSAGAVGGPDAHSRGFLYLLPLVPLTGEATSRLVEHITSTSARHSFRPAVTLNALDARVLEAVVSVTYDKATEHERALAYGNELLDRLADIGAFPYRLHIDQMERAVPADGPWADLMRRLKESFDPANIFSPGRYFS